MKLFREFKVFNEQIINSIKGETCDSYDLINCRSVVVFN